MKRINTTDSLFHDGDPFNGVQGTAVTAAWLNSVQEEIAHVVEAGGFTLDGADSTQLLQAIQKLATDTVLAVSNDVPFVGDTAISLPTKGIVRLFNLGGAANVIINAANLTANKLAVAVANIGGSATQVLGSNGVYVNMPAVANAVAPNYVTYRGGALPQGLWSNVTYGRSTYFGAPPSLNNVRALGAVNLAPALTVYVMATSAGLLLRAYNPQTFSYGTSLSVSALAGQAVSGVFTLSATSFLVVTRNGVVACSVNAGTLVITPGNTPALGLAGLSSNTDVGPVPGGGYLCVGASSGTTLGAVIVTVSGTTSAVSALATGPSIGVGGGWSTLTLDCGDASNAMVGFFDNGTGATAARAVAISIAAGVPAFSASVLTLATISGTYGSNGDGNGAVFVEALTATTYFCAYTSNLSSLIKCVVLSSAAGTITPGTAVGNTDTHSTNYNYSTKRTMPYPYASPRFNGSLAVFKYAPGVYIVCGAGTTIYTVSGVTVTPGTLNTGMTVAQNVDGTWVYSGATFGTKLFTVVSAAFVSGDVISATGYYTADRLTGISATLCGAGMIKTGGAWYGYVGANSYLYPISASGQGLTANSAPSASSIYLQDYFA